jgi:hypothetical protein
MSNDMNRPEEPLADPSEEPQAEPTPEPVDPGAAPSETARTLGMACHLLGFAGVTGIPFANILGPLVMWLVKREEYPFVDDQGKQALNFQISFTIYGIVAFFSLFILIGFLLLPAVGITWIVLTIIAAVRAQKGEAYRYPLTIPFMK